MSTMTVSAAPQGSQTQGEMQYTTEASESDLAASMLIMPTIMERACEFDGGSAARGIIIIF